MTATTADSMNFLIQKNEERISAKIPSEMKRLIRKQAEVRNLTESQYIKLSIQNQLIKDLGES